MKMYFAPLEGITDALFRRVHHDMFPGMSKYFMPFISPSASLSFTGREMFDLSPRENSGVPAVPQILAREPDYFLGTARMLRDAGYTEVNLNIGCPSGTVTGKGKGAGMLKAPDQLRSFLDAVFSRTPLPVSVKTRLGFFSPDEWPALLNALLDYPLHELILHPRTAKERYAGLPHTEAIVPALERAPFPVIYNGDLFTREDAWDRAGQLPGLSGLMLGRGIVANPALGREAAGGPSLKKEELAAFHDRLLRAYLTHWPESAAIGRMHAITGSYLCCCFRDAHRHRRQIGRAATAEAYQDAVRRLFEECDLASPPVFIPPHHETPS